MAQSKRSLAPWWIAAAIAGVAAIVVAVKVMGKDREQDLRDIEVDTVPEPPETLRVRVVARHPHDGDAFTQGLVWHGGHLYESTGLRGRSSLRKIDLASGEVLARRDIPAPIFAEGLARVGDRLFQISWENEIAHVWTLDGFEPVRTFEYEGEGWGLCFDGTHLVMSDGSDALTFRDPESFRAVREVRVHREGESVDQLNELECVDGVVWANIWQSDEIVRIDPESGDVTGVVDASGLLNGEELSDADVLNGIAWIPERRRFVITGKLWPAIFEVEFVPEDR